MWEPTTDELKTANVINGVADPYKFAVSGYGSNTTRERMWTKFHEVRVYAALAKTNPNAYEQFIDLWHAGYIAGRSEGELIDEVRTKIYPIINSYRRFADDETIQEIGRLALAQLKALAAKDKNACYEYASGNSNDYITYLPPALVNQELDLNARVLETAHDSPNGPKGSRRELEDYSITSCIALS
jgi:hypothetical protein